MWIHIYSKVFKDVNRQDIWRLWADINRWHTWNPGIDYCQLKEPFAKGSHFTLKPKNAPAVTLQLVDVEDGYRFTDCTTFFGAKMYGMHEIEETAKGVTLITTMKITGPLGFLWRKLVAEKIVAKIPKQTQALVDLARKNDH